MTAESTTTTTIKGPSSGTDWICRNATLLTHKATTYQSPDTGLRGLVVTTDEPLCSLHIVLATCATTNNYSHKHDGLPHTLEHLVFLGSQDYPFKGILDKLANRSLADGTNAWTATDHTAYTLTTAGQEGVLNLLPIYANHVLYPTLTEQGFLTEVHHVTKEGTDKGVVYCEMQGRENSEGSLVDRAVMELLYKGCGYSSETGGKLKNLRSLTNQQVQRYHEENYTADNCLFVLSGNVDAHLFLEKLDLVEQQIKNNGASIRKMEERPWVHHPIPDLDTSAVGIMNPNNHNNSNNCALEITFPSEDESRGTVSMAWRGPSYHQRTTWVNLKLLWDYLTDSAASPLLKALVECNDPVCAGVDPAHEIFTVGYHQVWCTEVDMEKMETVAAKFFEVLQKQVSQDFDLERMRMVIRRKRRKLLEYSERRPTDAMMDGVIRNFLYAPRNEEELTTTRSLEADVNELPLLDKALTLEKEVWIQLLQDSILSQPYALVLGRPSAELAKQMAQDEKKREAKQAQELGPTKLKELGEQLQAAIEYNERDIPDKVLTSISIPSLQKVKAVPVLTICVAGNSLKVAPNSGRGVPKDDAELVLLRLRDSASQVKDTDAFYVDWGHIESAFLYATVGLSTKDLTTRQRLYLDLLLELAFKLPATLEDGTSLSKDEFVSQLQDDTVSYAARCGLSGSSVSQMISFSVQIEVGQGLESALKWIRRVLYLTTFTVDTVKMAAQKLLSEIPAQIRHGPTICSAVSNELNYNPDKSNKIACSALRQWPFLDELLQQMEEPGGAEKLVDELNSIRQELTKQKNIQCFVAGNMKQISDPMQTLVQALRPPDETEGNSNVKAELLTDVTALTVRSTDTGRAAICSLSAIESSFLSVTSQGVGAYDPDHASLLVAIEYLTALEGDFWVKLRGAGLTYGSSISNMTESKLLKFGLFKCTDIGAAFTAASHILVEYASGQATISEIGLESAKSSLAYNIILSVSTKLSAAIDAWVGSYVGKQVDYDQWLLVEISKVTADDAMHALVTYLIPLFDPGSNLAVTCPTNKVDEISEYFAERGWSNVEKVPEDKLCKAFVKSAEQESMPSLNVPEPKAGVSMFMPGAFAAQFQCSCIRCGRDANE